MVDSLLALSADSFCGSDVLCWGVKTSVLRAPLHTVVLRSPLVSGPVVGLRPTLPGQGVAMILGNDLAGQRVFVNPEVIETLLADVCFGSCCCQLDLCDDVLDLSDWFLCDQNVPKDAKIDL